MSRFQNPSRYAPASQIVLTTTEADIALEQFQNDSSFLFEQLDSQKGEISTESFSKLKDVVMTTISAILKKIGELIKRFLNWINGNKKGVKKEVEETKKSTQSAYEKADACFRNPETREEAIKILMEKNSKFFGRDFLNNFIHDKNRDAVYEAVINSSPIFNTNYFSLDRGFREDMLESTRKLVLNSTIQELDKSIKQLAQLAISTDDRSEDAIAIILTTVAERDYCLSVFSNYAKVFCEKDIDLPDDAPPSVIMEMVTSLVRDRVNWLKEPAGTPVEPPTKERHLLNDVEDLEFNLYRLEQGSDDVSHLEDTLYKLNSDLLKTAAKKTEEKNTEASGVITEMVKFYSAVISTVLHVNNAFYTMAVQVTKAVHSATDAVGKLLDEVAKEVKQNDKPTTESVSTKAPASQIVLTTTEADIALEQFQNDSSFLFEQLDSHKGTVTTESFSKVKDVVMTTISAILKKIGELIKRFVNWIKGNKKDVKKKIDKTKTQTQTVYQKSESLFDNPDTREEALKLLKAKNEKYFGRNFLNGLTRHSNDDIILTAVLNSSPIFKTTYFKLGRDHLQDLLLAGRKLLYSEPFKNLEPAIRELAESRLRNDLGDGLPIQEVYPVSVCMVGCMADLTSYAETITGREIEYPDEAAPSVILELLSNNIRDAVQLLITPVEGDFQKIKYLGKLHDIVTDLEDHVRILDDITDRISDVEDSLYKLTSDLAKMSNKASASGHDDVASKITELVKIYNAIISTVLHVNNTFYKMAIQTTDAIYNSAMDIGKILDDVAKEVKQSDKPTTESISSKPPTFKHQLALGIEGISFQDGSFFNALVEKVQDLRDSKDYSPKNIEKNGINQMVFEKTGMLIDFVVDPSPDVNAFLLSPILDKNHPFVPLQWREFAHSEAINLVTAGGGELKGTVDLNNARVGGIYSKVEFILGVTLGMVDNKRYSSEEIAAAICHELGHLFTYFEMFGRINRTANIVSAMCRAMYDMEDQQQRETIIKQAAKTLQITIEDPSELARIQRGKREDICATVFVTKAVHASRSETGYHAYEMRSCEQLADDFAMRMGAGRHLATINNKIYKLTYESSTLSTGKHMLIQLAATIYWMTTGASFGFMIGGFTVVGMAIGAVAMPLLILMLADPNEKIYDNGEDRIMLMKRTLVTALKNKDLPEELRKSYLSEITAIDEIVKKLDFKRGIFEYIITTFSVRGRREYRQEQIMKDVENLLTNDLFVHAQQLRAGV